MNLRISEIAESVGVSSDTIRYYEREGLLPAPARSVSGYRQYDQGIIDRLRFIKGAQAFGLRLSEIGELLEIQDKGACPCGHTEARQAGADIPRFGAPTFWGGYSGIFIDLDGHPWEVAHNPGWTLHEDGRTTVD